MRGWLAAGMILLVVASGCVGGVGEKLGSCDPFVDVSVFHPEASEQAVLQRGASTSIPVMVWVENQAPGPITVEMSTSGAEATALIAEQDDGSGLTVEEDGRLFEAFSFEQPEEGSELSLVVRSTVEELGTALRDPLCDDTHIHREAFTAGVQPEAEAVEPGRGVLVHTVGWWTNGTSFYTNMQRFDDRSELPKGYVGDEVNPDPLKVYVYNESGDERPERYNESGYATTIPGFNEALKRMETVGGHVTSLDPAEAYTRDGYEEHRLYGDKLVFYIEAVETRTVPCEVPQPICTTPEPSRDASPPAWLLPVVAP